MGMVPVCFFGILGSIMEYQGLDTGKDIDTRRTGGLAGHRLI